MGGACTCHSVIKNCFSNSSDYILNPVNSIPKIHPNKIPEKNMKINHNENSEDIENEKSCNVNNTKKNKIQINKNNISNIVNINDDINLNINEDNKRKSSNINKNSVINLNQENSKRSKNIPTKNILHHNKTFYEHYNNNSKQKVIEKRRDILKKAETNYNYNMGENNFIFINISKGSSIIRNDSEKKEPSTPKMSIDKASIDNMANRNKRIYSHFSKSKLNNNFNSKNLVNNNNKKLEENKNLLYMNNYSEEMLKVVNSIRKNPESFLQYIDNAIRNNIQKLNDDIYIVSRSIDEKVKIMEDYLLIFEQIKKILKEFINSNKSNQLEEFKYNNELEIIFNKPQGLVIDQRYREKLFLNDFNINNTKNNNNTTLDLTNEDIANIILVKRKQIKKKYPKAIFKLNIIKDIEINFLIQISMDLFDNKYHDEIMLKNIIFNPDYKNFAVSWTNEINRDFISVSCFA